MIAHLYLLAGIIILILQVLGRSHRTMSLLGVLHSMAVLIITLLLAATPQEWTPDPLFMIDHLNLVIMIITGLVFTCASVYAVGYIDGLVRDGELDRRSLKIFYTGFSLLLLATTLALYSPSVAQFWIFAELTTVFSALLVAILAVKENIDASLKYIFVCSTSMLFSFIGIIFFFELIRQATGEGSLDWQVIRDTATTCDGGMLGIASIFFFIGFAAKSGIVPLHTWLPEAHAKAPSAVSAVLSGAILNIGLYGILRIAGILHQSEIAGQMTFLFIIFGMVTMSVAAFSMLKQTGMKQMIAFSSVENMGFMLLAIGIGTPVALFWMVYHMIGHSLVKTGLFFSAGIIHRQYRSHTPGKDDTIADLFTMQPFAACTFIIGSVAIMGTPLFPLFLSKFGILLEAGKITLYLPLVVLLLFAAAATAIIRFLLSAMEREFPEGKKPEGYEPSIWMKVPIIVLLILSLSAGVLMLPVEEQFLMAAITDIGIGGAGI